MINVQIIIALSSITQQLAKRRLVQCRSNHSNTTNLHGENLWLMAAGWIWKQVAIGIGSVVATDRKCGLCRCDCIRWANEEDGTSCCSLSDLTVLIESAIRVLN